MTILAIDTSDAAVSSALLPSFEGEPITQPMAPLVRFDLVHTGQAEAALAQIKSLQLEAEDMFQMIKLLVVTVGPGRFTSLRIGLSVMRSLALALDVPLIGLSSLHVSAFKWAQKHVCQKGASSNEFAVIRDSGRGFCFVEQFADLRHRGQGPQLVALSDLDAVLSLRKGGVLLFDVAWDTKMTEMTLVQSHQVDFTPEGFGPDGLHSALLARDLYRVEGRNLRLRSGAGAAYEGLDVKPLYLRPADAKPQAGRSLARA